MHSMTLRLRTALTTATSLLVLAACGGGGGGGGPAETASATCAFITGPGTSTTGTFQCSGGGCTIENHDAAIDANPDSAAILRLRAATSGVVGLRGNAAGEYAAGTPAGMVWSVTRGPGTSAGVVAAITTYLNDVPQETSNLNIDGTSGDRNPQKSLIATSRPFDSVGLSYQQSGGTADVDVLVHEFCTS